MRFLHIAFVLAICCVPVAAQSFSYASFAGATGLALNGSASLVAATGTLQLTPDANSQSGQAYAAVQMPVVAGFDTTFQFKVTHAAAYGGEGMAFIVHNSPSGSSAIGGGGNGLGYSLISNALVVELDMIPNTALLNDTGPNEVSIHTQGQGGGSASEHASIGRVLAPAPMMNDQQVHTVRILYVPGTISVWLDNMAAPVLVRPWDFASGSNWVNSGLPVGGLNLPNATAWVGFTAGTSAGTGGIWQAHEILNWTFASSAAVVNCVTGNIGVGTLPTPAQVLSVNASWGGAPHIVNTYTFLPLSVAYAPVPATAVTPFVIWGTFAPTGAQTPFSSPIGDFCFLPPILDPFNPLVFTLTDNIGLGLPGLVPSTAGAWSFTLPAGIHVPLSFRLQGAIIDALGPQIMNAVTVNVLPHPAPTITSVTPLFGNAGATVTINGTNFATGCMVTFGGVAATITSQTPPQIVTSVPAGVPCPGTIMVTNPDGQFATRPFNQPIITGTPNGSGSAAGGVNLSIYGQGFAPPCTVTIGGNPATIVTNTTSQIICTTPPGTIGVAPVVVTTAQGCTATTTYAYL